MAAEIGYQYFVQVNGVNLSNRVREATYSDQTDQIEAAASGDLAHVRLPGLSAASLRVKFIQDYAIGSVYRTLHPLVNSTFPVVYRKDGTAVTGPTNPQLTMTVMMEGFDAVSGSVGQLMELDVTFSLASGNPTWAEA